MLSKILGVGDVSVTCNIVSLGGVVNCRVCRQSDLPFCSAPLTNRFQLKRLTFKRPTDSSRPCLRTFKDWLHNFVGREGATVFGDGLHTMHARC
jgi:hypothetical protein